MIPKYLLKDNENNLIIASIDFAEDIVEIVRCKNCKHFSDNGSCLLLQGLTVPTPNEYCSYGERKETK